MIEVAVTVNLECAHRSAIGVMHGHSYLVEVWFPAKHDLVMLGAMVRDIAARVDHGVLEETVGASSMEAIASWFLKETNASRIIVRRPTLGYAVEAKKDA